VKRVPKRIEGEPVEYGPKKPNARAVGSDPYFTLMADSDGVGFVQCGDGVLVVPLTDDSRVLMAVERSPAFDRDVLVLVGGEVEEDEPMEETANRELQEELGWRAERIEFLGELHPFKYLANRQFVFLARDLTPSKLESDEMHPVGTRKVPLDSFIDLCTSGELHDASAIAALCLAQRFIDAGGEMSDVNKFEEYKLFVEDTARFTDRRQTVTNIYVAINTVLLSGVALLVDGGLENWVMLLAAEAILVGGIAVCLFWRQLIHKYKALVGLRIRELRRMEELPEMVGCHQMYHAEDELYPRDEDGEMIKGQGLNISDLERRLPWAFIVLYVVFGAGIAIAWAMGLI
jgi:8-oxo-dGTP pyrophosphatase MutT (NUDIX family)